MPPLISNLPTLLPDLLFYFFSALSIAGAISILARRNPMTCAVSLVVSVLSIAILYFLLSAHFVAVAQMIVYAGAIVVLFIFVIMLLNLTEEELGKFKFSLFKLVGAFVAVATLLFVAPRVRSSMPAEIPGEPVSVYGGTREVGRLLFGEFILPFELTSVLILSAMVIGVVLAKKDLTPKKTFSLVDWLLGLLGKSK